MGDAFITRRSSTAKEQKTIFNNTPMVAVKTLQNALSLGRFDMAVASDDEYIAFLCGLDGYGRPVSNLDIFTRSGQHYVAYWPDELTDMAAVIDNHKLIGIGGRYSDGTASKMVKRWYLAHAIQDSGTPVIMTDLPSGRYGASATHFADTIVVAGGILGNGEPCNGVFIYSYLNKKNTNNNAGYLYLFEISISRGFAAIGDITTRGVLLAGGKTVNSPAVYDRVDVIGKDVNSNYGTSNRGSLAVAQHSPTQATIYAQGRRYCLFGLGKTLPKTQGGLVVPETIVPNIDVYVSSIDDVNQIDVDKNSTFTLPLEGRPTSAVALSFGDCVLYVVGYSNGVTKSKGYLVQLEPLRITTMEFNFSRNYTQGGVIGNDVGFLTGGTKNGQVSTDVEMIQLLRNVPIYPGMKYKVGSMASEETSNILTLHPLNDEIKLSGYMKL